MMVAVVIMVTINCTTTKGFEMEVDKRNAEQVARMVSDFLNVASIQDVNKFVETMSNEHRTLQQLFTRLCVEWFRNLSDRETYDLRNEASVLFAKQNKDTFANVHIPFI